MPKTRKSGMSEDRGGSMPVPGAGCNAGKECVHRSTPGFRRTASSHPGPYGLVSRIICRVAGDVSTLSRDGRPQEDAHPPPTPTKPPPPPPPPPRARTTHTTPGEPRQSEFRRRSRTDPYSDRAPPAGKPRLASLTSPNEVQENTQIGAVVPVDGRGDHPGSQEKNVWQEKARRDWRRQHRQPALRIDRPGVVAISGPFLIRKRPPRVLEHAVPAVSRPAARRPEQDRTSLGDGVQHVVSRRPDRPWRVALVSRASGRSGGGPFVRPRRRSGNGSPTEGRPPSAQPCNSAARPSGLSARSPAGRDSGSPAAMPTRRPCRTPRVAVRAGDRSARPSRKGASRAPRPPGRLGHRIRADTRRSTMAKFDETDRRPARRRTDSTG
jgi:hypothetical protein